MIKPLMFLWAFGSISCMLPHHALAKQNHKHHNSRTKTQTPIEFSFEKSRLPAVLFMSHLPPELLKSHLPSQYQKQDKTAKTPPTNIKDVVRQTYQNRKLKIIDAFKHLSKKDRQEATCLALNIYHEARSSSEQDQMAVAFVSLNRLDAGGEFGKSLCGVIGQRRGTDVAPQFSWLIMSAADSVPREQEPWIKAQELAIKIYSRCYVDITDGALYYWNPKTAHHGSWMDIGTSYQQIGYHLYMKTADDDH